jgi:hypothetical protein
VPKIWKFKEESYAKEMLRSTLEVIYDPETSGPKIKQDIQGLAPHIKHIIFLESIPVAARSKASAFGRKLAGIVSSNSTGGMNVCLLWVFVLSGTGLCDGLITRREESYRVWCV